MPTAIETLQSEEFEALPVERQEAYRQEVLGRVIASPSYQELSQVEPARAKQFLLELSEAGRRPQAVLKRAPGFVGRTLERAGVPQSLEGVKEHPFQTALGAAFLPFAAGMEAVDTSTEALGKQRPISPGLGVQSVELGDIVGLGVGTLPSLLRRAPVLMEGFAWPKPFKEGPRAPITQPPYLPPRGPAIGSQKPIPVEQPYRGKLIPHEPEVFTPIPLPVPSAIDIAQQKLGMLPARSSLADSFGRPLRKTRQTWEPLPPASPVPQLSEPAIPTTGVLDVFGKQVPVVPLLPTQKEVAAAKFIPPLQPRAKPRIIKPNEEGGRIKPQVLLPLAGATVGGVAGATAGDTPVEQVAGGVLGAIAGGAGGRLAAGRLPLPPLPLPRTPSPVPQPTVQGVEPLLQAEPLQRPFKLPQPPTLPERLRVPLETPDVIPIPKYARSINLNRTLTDDDVKQDIIRTMSVVRPRRPVTHKEVLENAPEYTLTDAERLNRAMQRNMLGFLASRQVGTKYAERYTAAKQAYQFEPTAENFERLRVADLNTVRASKAKSELASSLGLGLNLQKIGASGRMTTDVERGIDKLLQEIEAKGRFSDELTLRRAATNLDDPEAVRDFYQFLTAKNATTREKVFEYYISMMLTGPQTHSANIAGNVGAVLFHTLGDLPLAAVSSAVRAPFHGGQRERFFGETPAFVYGMTVGLSDAARVGIKSFLNGTTTFGSKLDLPREISIGGRVGHVTRTSLRLLSGTDEFFKSFIARGQLQAEAYRVAAREGHKGQALLTRASQLVKERPEELMEAAFKTARELTFQRELGSVAGLAMQGRRALPSSEFLIPFVTTPINIAKFGVEHTPLNLLKILHKRKQLKGGELDDEVAKAAVGSILGFALWAPVQAGMMTGSSPIDPEQRRQWDVIGKKPIAIKWRGEYHSLERFEPVATTIGLIADFHNLTPLMTTEERNKVPGLIVNSISRNLMNKTYMQAFNQVLDILHDPDINVVNTLAGQTAGSFMIPAIIGQATRANDPYLREARSILERIQSRVPSHGALGVPGREDLFPKRDPYGLPIPAATGGFLERFLSPMSRRKEQATALDQLAIATWLELGSLPRSIDIKGKRFDLTPAEYDLLGQIQGRFTSKAIPLYNARAQEEGRPTLYDIYQVSPELAKIELRKAIAQVRQAGTEAFKLQLTQRGRLTPRVQERVQQFLTPPPKPLPFSPFPLYP